MAGNIVSTTDGNFDRDVIQSNVITLVDFWAEWCGPCRALAPKLEEIANEMTGQVQIMKVNIDENQGTPSKYGVRGIPTLIVFKGGKAVDQIVGNHPKESIVNMLKKHV